MQIKVLNDGDGCAHVTVLNEVGGEVGSAVVNANQEVTLISDGNVNVGLVGETPPAEDPPADPVPADPPPEDPPASDPPADPAPEGDPAPAEDPPAEGDPAPGEPAGMVEEEGHATV